MSGVFKCRPDSGETGQKQNRKVAEQGRGRTEQGRTDQGPSRTEGVVAGDRIGQGLDDIGAGQDMGVGQERGRIG